MASRAPDAGPPGASHPPVGNPAAPAQQASSLNDAFQQATAGIDQQAPPTGQAEPAPTPAAPQTPLIDSFRARGFEINGIATDDDFIAALAQQATEHQQLLAAQQQAPAAPVAPEPQAPVQQAPTAPPQHGEQNAEGRRFNSEWLNRARWNEQSGAFEAINPRFTADAEQLNQWVEGNRAFQREFYDDPGSVINPLIEQRFNEMVKPLQDKIAEYEQRHAQQAVEDTILQYPDLTAVDPTNPQMRMITPKGQVFRQALEDPKYGALSLADRQEIAYFKAQNWEQQQAVQQQARPVIAPPRPQPQTPIGMAMQQPAVPSQPVVAGQSPQQFTVREAWQQQVLNGATGNGGLSGGAGLGHALANQIASPTPRINSTSDAFQQAVMEAQAAGLVSM